MMENRATTPSSKERDAEGSSCDIAENTPIDWDGPDDPANPQNWPKAIRLSHVAFASTFTLVVNLASTMVSPGTGKLGNDFGVTSATLLSFSVTIYLLGFSVGPLFIAPLSEVYGRLILYHVNNAVFLCFIIGSALSPNIGAFLAFRFLSGCAGSAPLTIGGGTVADVTTPDQRGIAMGIFGLGPLLGPAVGPVIGGFIAQNTSWRWIFWVIALTSGLVSLLALLMMRETYRTVILAKKAKRLGRSVGNPSGVPLRTLLLRSLRLPIKLLFLNPIVLALSAYGAFVFGLCFLLFTTFSTVFRQQYGFTIGTAGLGNLGVGIGMLSALFIFSITSDKVAAKLTAASGENKPEYRLPLMVWTSPAIPIGFFWYGWSAHSQTHWIVPIIGTYFVGLGAVCVVITSQIYLVDTFGPQAAASALAAFSVLRSLFGAFLPLAGPSMYDALGLGWGNSLLGFVAIGFMPIPILLYRYGERLRNKNRSA